MMLDQLLKALNLNEKESQIASVLHATGTVRASSVARASDLPRNTVRGILDSLVTRGIVFKTRLRNAQYYGLETRENLLLTLRQQRELLEQEFEQKISAVEKLGGVLDSNQLNQKFPKVTFYDGYQGIQRVYEDTLSSKSGLRSWGSFDANIEALPRYFKTYYSRRAKKNIKMKSLHPDTSLAIRHNKNDHKELRTSVLVPKEKYSWRPEIQVYDDKVNIVSWSEKLGIIIQSKEISEAFKTIFDLCYESAEKTFKP